MSDLISRQAAIDAIKRYESADSYDLNNGLILAMNAVADVPTIDVPDRKFGEWKEIDLANYKALCSQCGTWSPIMGRFCPNCGAKMERSEE